MLFTPAFAQDAASAAAAAPAGSGLASLLPLILIFVIFYFLLIRPQQKKFKQHQAMISAVARGDKIVTAGGVVGTVVKVESDEFVQVEIAKDVVVKLSRPTIANVLSRSGAAGAEKPEKTANDN